MTWNFKANLRGAPGYNATGAVEDAAALAAFALETAGPNAFGTALNGKLDKVRAAITPATVKNTVIVAGDSIASQCGSTAQAIIDKSFYHSSWMHWANTALDHRLTITKNAGVGGNTTAQLLARLDADVINQPGEIVALNIGVNDLFNGAGTTLATMKANLTEIVGRILAAGKKIAWNTTTPSGYSTTTTRANQADLNAWIKSYGKAQGGAVTVIDMFAVSAGADGLPIPGYSHEATMVHPGMFVCAAMGKAWADAMQGEIFRYGAGPNALSRGDNLLGAVGTFAGNTAGVATGWTLQSGAGGAVPASVTARKVHRTYRGETREMQEINRTLATETARLFWQTTAVGVDWNPGDTVTLSVTLDHDDIASTAPGSGLSIEVQFWNALGGASGMQMPSSEFLAPTPTGLTWISGNRTYQSPPLVIPAGTARLQVFLNAPLGRHRYVSAVLHRTPAP